MVKVRKSTEDMFPQVSLTCLHTDVPGDMPQGQQNHSKLLATNFSTSGLELLINTH